MSDFKNPLLTRWPELHNKLPYLALGVWPTPVEALENAVDGQTIWVKREDLSSPRFGGNKVRKLEFLLGVNERDVLTFGPLGSHHVLTTAIHARHLGRGSIAVLVPQLMTPHHEIVHEAIKRICTHTVILNSARDLLRTLVLIARSFLPEISRRSPLLLIPPGATSPRGTLGWVAAGLNSRNKCDGALALARPGFYVALGTGGTAVGLAMGLALAGLDSEVVAVRVASRLSGNRAFLHLLEQRTLRLLNRAGLRVDLKNCALKIDHRFIGPKYAYPTAAANEALKLGKELHLELETTYTGKAFAALLEDLRTRPQTGPLMLINTAGSLSLVL